MEWDTLGRRQKVSSVFSIARIHMHIYTYIHTYIIFYDFIGTASFLSGMGDYDNQEELDGEDEDAGEWTLVDSLHALSIGCREEEAWKR